MRVIRKPGPGQAALDAAMKGIDGKVGKVGWFKTAHEPDGTPTAYVAAINEFGYPEGNIPPRLGMRATANENKGKYAGTAKVMSQRIIAGQATGADAMEAIGLQAAGDLRKRIATVKTPPLKPSTVRARLAGKKIGKSISITVAKPLVNTKTMLNSVSNVVEDK